MNTIHKPHSSVLSTMGVDQNDLLRDIRGNNIEPFEYTVNICTDRNL